VVVHYTSAFVHKTYAFIKGRYILDTQYFLLLLKKLIFYQEVRSCSSTVYLCLPVERLVSLLFNHITYIKRDS
jgi:hypothetical protein